MYRVSNSQTNIRTHICKIVELKVRPRSILSIEYGDQQGRQLKTLRHSDDKNSMSRQLELSGQLDKGSPLPSKGGGDSEVITVTGGVFPKNSLTFYFFFFLHFSELIAMTDTLRPFSSPPDRNLWPIVCTIHIICNGNTFNYLNTCTRILWLSTIFFSIHFTRFQSPLFGELAILTCICAKNKSRFKYKVQQFLETRPTQMIIFPNYFTNKFTNILLKFRINFSKKMSTKSVGSTFRNFFD